MKRRNQRRRSTQKMLANFDGMPQTLEEIFREVLREAQAHAGEMKMRVLGEDQSKRRFSVDVREFRRGDEKRIAKKPAVAGSRGICEKMGPSG